MSSCREFITLLGGAAAAWPLAARVGYIRAGTPNDDQVREEFVRGMRDLGYIEGRNITYEFRHYGDDVESIPSLRKEEYRERQCRANRQQHHKLSKPSTSHDMQRQRSECSFLGLTPMHSTASAVIPRWDFVWIDGRGVALRPENVPYKAFLAQRRHL
jgi:hypothetical protein